MMSLTNWLAVYTVSAETKLLLWLLWLIPLCMALVAFFTVKRNRLATHRKWAEDDARIAERMAEIAQEKALEDDFGYDRFDENDEN